MQNSRELPWDDGTGCTTSLAAHCRENLGRTAHLERRRASSDARRIAHARLDLALRSIGDLPPKTMIMQTAMNATGSASGLPAAVADCLGPHYSTLSMIAKRIAEDERPCKSRADPIPACNYAFRLHDCRKIGGREDRDLQIHAAARKPLPREE